MQKRGLFISFEGGEGAGKSTQTGQLALAFEAAGRPCLKTREPGGSAGAEEIRTLIVTGAADRWGVTTETLLLMAARADHVERMIAPALAAGTTIICDRFFDSTRIYQGVAKGMGQAWLSQLYHLLFGNLAPDITFYLDLDPAIGLTRTTARSGNETRFEQMDSAFHQTLRDGFLQLAADEPSRIACLDATQNADALHQQIIEQLQLRLGICLAPATMAS